MVKQFYPCALCQYQLDDCGKTFRAQNGMVSFDCYIMVVTVSSASSSSTHLAIHGTAAKNTTARSRPRHINPRAFILVLQCLQAGQRMSAGPVCMKQFIRV